MEEQLTIGLCQCGCKRVAPISQKTDKKSGHIKGKPKKYIWGHNPKTNITNWFGDKNPRWNGRKTNRSGYPSIYDPQHHRADNSGYVFSHIIIAENALGKPLPLNVVIHHANGTKDSGPLVICQDRAYHNLLHQRMRALKACGHAGWRKCRHCKKYDAPINMTTSGKGIYHKSCEAEYKQKRRTGEWNESQSNL